MANYVCIRCADTGVLFAGLVKDEKRNNLGISVVICDHFDDATEKTMEALAVTGLPLTVKAANVVAETAENFVEEALERDQNNV